MNRDAILKLLEDLFGSKFDELKEYLTELTDAKLTAFHDKMETGGTKNTEAKLAEALKEFRGPQINIGMNEAERFEVSLLKLLAGTTEFGEITKSKEDAEYYGIRAVESYINSGRPALPPVRRLSEWFYDFCGGIDAAIDGKMQNERILEAAGSTTSLASIVKNTVNILMANDYAQRELWWERIVTQEDVETLDPMTLVRTYGVNTLSVVAEGAAYAELAVADDEEGSSYVKRGDYIGITLETFLTDKLAYLKTMPRRLSAAWFNTVSDHVAAVFTCNAEVGPQLADTGALFNATAIGTPGGHVNLLTAGLSHSAYGAAKLAMAKQTDQPLGVGRKLGVVPKYLLVPSDLEAVARTILKSELVPGQYADTSAGEIQTVNVYRDSFEIIVVPGWTDTVDWALIADPALFPVIHLIWLTGRRKPEIVVQDDEMSGAMFTNDTLRFKVRLFLWRFSETYDCAPVSDFRGVHKSNV